MPGLNHTGPLGQGPMTGRKMGKCTNFGANKKNDDADATSNGISAGFGNGSFRGKGLGCGCRRGNGRGMGRGRGMGPGYGNRLDSGKSDAGK
ncbi:MAG: DUF5320 domain-containing protein [Bacteroidales bacterium]|nr:DUF5320 domain-containing protein [Bacteroidales bacterium]MCI2122075.1 DUF5320 domain-containing protein [Bacteroidales bacterium]MCI2146314.1 DUF5320 domain-containing protein [Bacteroidales bacterium]